MDHPFRSAALGGFNRQDVLDYLEKTSAENAQRQQELQQNLETAEEERRQLAAKTAEQEEQLSILHRERDGLSQQLEQAQQALAASQDREEAQERELAALRQERDSLKARVAELEPEAAAYEAVKERTAGVELEAHCRPRTFWTRPTARPGTCAGAWSSGWAGWSGSMMPCAARWSPPSPTRPTSWRRPTSAWTG